MTWDEEKKKDEKFKRAAWTFVGIVLMSALLYLLLRAQSS